VRRGWQLASAPGLLFVPLSNDQLSYGKNKWSAHNNLIFTMGELRKACCDVPLPFYVQ
jgi:hypothetical protein